MTQSHLRHHPSRRHARPRGYPSPLMTSCTSRERLDEIGVPYIEGGWPGSNDKDRDFFRAPARCRCSQAQIAAFGSTRRAGAPARSIPRSQLLLEAETPIVTIVGKSWDLHVHHVLETTLDENLAMIGDSVRYLREQGRRVFYDAEHFFDGYKANPDYALATIGAAAACGRGVRHPVRDQRRRAAVGGRGHRPQGVCLPDRARGRARGRRAGADRAFTRTTMAASAGERAGRGARGRDAGAGHGQRLRRAGGQLQPLYRDPRSPAQDGVPLPG